MSLRHYILLVFICFVHFSVFCQTSKLVLDTSMLGKWPFLSDNHLRLSDNGEYAAYVIRRQPLGYSTLVIRETRGDRQQAFVAKDFDDKLFFSNDSRKLCWKSGDSLLLQEVGNNKPAILLGLVASYKYPAYKAGEWVGFALKGREREVVLLNILTGKELRYRGVNDYWFDDRGKGLLVYSRDSAGGNRVQWTSLTESSSQTIWSGVGNDQVADFRFDQSGDQVAFTGRQENGTVIWYYKAGMDKAVIRVTNSSPGIRKGLQVAGLRRGFIGNGRWLFFELSDSTVQPGKAVKKSDGVQVDVWSYRDEVLYPAQQEIRPAPLIGVVDVTGDKVVCLNGADEQIVFGNMSDLMGDHIVLYDRILIENDRWWWPHGTAPSYWIVSLQDGSRRLLKKESTKKLYGYSWSPTGRFLVYWDPSQKGYMCYDTKLGNQNNITFGIPANFLDDFPTGTGRDSYPDPEAEAAGWYVNDEKVLIYDHYDIWGIDPSGKYPAVNLTLGYGKRNRIKLRLVYEREGSILSSKIVHRFNETILLTGTSIDNKNNGFFRLRVGSGINPIELILKPYLFYQTESQLLFYSGGTGMIPVQSKDGGSWIVRRESASEFRNYYYTKDFKEFQPLTNLQPQQSCNWLKAELVNWRMFDGKISQGVLYKPDNFDPSLKYPVIFNYYEKRSDYLNAFLLPNLSNANINIPWFVSRGYLVFTPDIHYAVAAEPGGRTVGESAYNAVVSAAEYLSKLPYVDGKRMGIQGHSFGGLQTSYLVTHSKVFAAACEAAGTTDPISAYLTLTGSQNERIHKMDHPQGRMGATIWERPDLYLRNSSVLSADKTVAPLLIMHNKIDGQVQWRQGVEFYMALRRLGKPCWMLQYDGEGHSLYKDDNILDYTIRMEQFFDHYLKGQPAPKWMTDGVPSAQKGISNGYELDPEGSCGVNCKVCKPNSRNK